MRIKSLTELREVDERTLVFNPVGLGGRMRPEDSTEYQQQVVARYGLVPTVTDATRQSFEQLRTIYAYGVLCYEIFTLVEDRALLVFEQALRDRFVDFHHGKVTFVDPRTGKTQELAATSYEQVFEFVSGNRKWELQIGGGPETMVFNGMLAGLRQWARRTGLLRGQRNRAVEHAITLLRDGVAHPNSYTLTTPVDAATTISDLAEIINHLWGSATPGGRLYPAPVHRTIIAVIWHQDGNQVMAGAATADPEAADHHQIDTEHAADDDASESGGEQDDDWTCVLMRGVLHDRDLLHFDAMYETARYPSEWLWGPGNTRDAMAWLAAQQPSGDEVDVLDRLFFLRYHDSLLYLPRSPDVAAAVTDDQRPGIWYVIRADSPDHAFNHMRQVLAGGYGCDLQGQCRQCPAEIVRAGSWEDAMNVLRANGVQVARREVPDIRVPCRMGWPRCNRILGNGSWDIPEEER